MRNRRKPRRPSPGALVTTMRWYGVVSAITAWSWYSLSSAQVVMWSALSMKPISTSSVTAQATACEAKCRSSWRNNHSAHSATMAFIRPNNRPVRASPRCGTSTNGNAIDTASAPR